jgi:hypothetical protein
MLLIHITITSKAIWLYFQIYLFVDWNAATSDCIVQSATSRKRGKFSSAICRGNTKRALQAVRWHMPLSRSKVSHGALLPPWSGNVGKVVSPQTRTIYSWLWSLWRTAEVCGGGRMIPIISLSTSGCRYRTLCSLSSCRAGRNGEKYVFKLLTNSCDTLEARTWKCCSPYVCVRIHSIWQATRPWELNNTARNIW